MVGTVYPPPRENPVDPLCPGRTLSQLSNLVSRLAFQTYVEKQPHRMWGNTQVVLVTCEDFFV